MLSGKRMYFFILVLLSGALATAGTNIFAATAVQNQQDASVVEQQRSLAEAKKAPSQREEVSTAKTLMTKEGVLPRWLHMLDREESTGTEGSSILAYGPDVPGDLTRVFDSIGEQNNTPGFFGVLLRSLLAIGLGWGTVLIVSRLARKRITQLQELTPPDKEGWAFFWTGVLRNIPAVVSLLVLAIVSTAAFLLMAGSIGVGGRMLFQALLGTVLIVQFCQIVSTIIFAPGNEDIRIIPITESLAKPFHRAVFLSFATLLSGFLILHLINGLGAKPQTLAWVRIVLGSSVLSVYGYVVIFLKKPVMEAFLTDIREKGGSWLKEQFAANWHLPALLYLLLVWFIWVGKELSGTFTANGSLIVSMLIVPIYFLMSFAVKSMIATAVDSLGLAKAMERDEPTGDEQENIELEADKRIAIIKKAHSVFNLILAAILTTWVFSLWGFQIPYAGDAVKALFKSLVVVALALVFWRFASSYLERKMEEAAPEAPEEDTDDEFGGAVARGRSHTLLPMVRKSLGTVLMVMVALIVISSLGVDIGPLLAGAGVLGLAVGFGAQKLVSDILSGFFFLLDDAFRVGEYIQAGKIRGTVEAITLRNVLLRHHLGMLQVVPHSDLGSVTNFMRGGIVIKFSLEFSYDTDIDKVRKIIKKVGQAMLEDEEIGDDFILPLKSQGVYEITNSVMVIRVKFTAKPGKQFVIKREAFRRITESLNAKGIFYAHRKVIVDIPSDNSQGIVDQETRGKLVQAGAAATLAAEADAQKEVEAKSEE